MKESTRGYVDPSFLIKSLTDYEGNPINVNQQMDVDEFLINFMDKLEADLKNVKADKKLLDCFTGKLHQQIIGIKCGHVNTKIDNFLAITVPVNSIDNLESGLTNFIHWDILEGKNKYHCYECNDKVDAKKRISINALPNTLIVTLKRFEYNYKNKWVNKYQT